MPSHYLNQWWLLVNRTIMNTPHWNLNQNKIIFIHKNKLKMLSAKWGPFCTGLSMWTTWWRNIQFTIFSLAYIIVLSLRCYSTRRWLGPLVPHLAEFLVGNEKTYLPFLSSQDGRYLKSFLMENKDCLPCIIIIVAAVDLATQHARS